MWHIALIGSGLMTALVGATVLGLAKPVDAVAMNVHATAAGRSPISEHDAIERAADGLFYVPVRSTSGRARLLVDTGASHVVLSHTDARNLGIQRSHTKRGTITTAGGPISADWVVVSELEIQGHVLHNVQAVVPHNDATMSLLGQNALAQFRAIKIEDDRLSFVK